MLVWIYFCIKCMYYNLIFVKTHEFIGTDRKTIQIVLKPMDNFYVNVSNVWWKKNVCKKKNATFLATKNLKFEPYLFL